MSEKPKFECPVCRGPLEVVWNGVGRWRVSCIKNDILNDDEEAPCRFNDVYGVDEADAKRQFYAKQGVKG